MSGLWSQLIRPPELHDGDPKRHRQQAPAPRRNPTGRAGARLRRLQLRVESVRIR